MNGLKALLCAAALATGFAASDPASAHRGGRGKSFSHSHQFHHGGHFNKHFHHHRHRFHHRRHIGVFVAAPLYWSYPSWYYAYPRVAVAPVYIERGDGSAAQPGYWYYCVDPPGYHPHVDNCPGGWLKVVPADAPPS